MTCNGCRTDERCPYCGRAGRMTHNLGHDAPQGLPTTGRSKEKQDE